MVDHFVCRDEVADSIDEPIAASAMLFNGRAVQLFANIEHCDSHWETTNE